MLVIENLTKVYDSGDEAISKVSFEVKDNKIISIIGPSGAGKSTLIRCINRLVEPSSGRIRFNGTEITSLSKSKLREFRKDVGMVFQEYSLIERLTVMENVISGRLGYLSKYQALRRKYPESDVRFARETLDRVGLDPAKYEDKRVDELSGGERQRVGIARSVVQEPDLILADEPTSSLDPETSNEVMKLLTDIARQDDIPVIINIHEVPLAEEHSDRILGLRSGSLVFDGPPTDLTESATDQIYVNDSSNNQTSNENSSDIAKEINTY